MKIHHLIFVLIALLSITACKNNSYAEKRKTEQKKWQEYKTARNLEISTDSAYCFNRPCPWPENLYFQTHRGAYIRLIEDDSTKRAAREGDEVILRYYSYDLDGTLVGDNHSNEEFRDGFLFVYSKNEYEQDPNIGIAWYDAVGCIHQHSKFEVIIDSKLGETAQREEVFTIRCLVDETTIRNQ
jgi:hypothetical protein